MTGNNDLVRIFENEQFGNVRVVMKDDEPWFVAADVCDVFGETNRNRAMQALDADEKGYTQTHTLGGEQRMAVVNEAGLYSLLFAMRPRKARGISEERIEQRQSKLRSFKRWITHEVIPSLRKTGSYSIAPQKPDSYTILDPVERAKRWIEEEETRQRLAATNRALVTENLIWKDGSVINALVRRYAVSACGGDFGKAWRSFYKEILYKHSIGIEKRKTAWCDQHPGQKPPAGYKFLQGAEVSKGVSCIVSMCQEAGIEVGDILENFEQKALVAC